MAGCYGIRQCGRRFSNPRPERPVLDKSLSQPRVGVHISLTGSLSFRHSFQRLLRTPASGYRNSSSGALTNVGAYGFSWSSSPAPSDTNAGCLYFDADHAYPLHTAYRAFARPVRCVQNLRAAFRHLRPAPHADRNPRKKPWRNHGLKLFVGGNYSASAGTVSSAAGISACGIAGS